MAQGTVECYQKYVGWRYQRNKWNHCKPYTIVTREGHIPVIAITKHDCIKHRIRASTKKRVFVRMALTLVNGPSVLKLTREKDRFCLRSSYCYSSLIEGKTNHILPHWNYWVSASVTTRQLESMFFCCSNHTGECTQLHAGSCTSSISGCSLQS